MTSLHALWNYLHVELIGKTKHCSLGCGRRQVVGEEVLTSKRAYRSDIACYDTHSWRYRRLVSSLSMGLIQCSPRNTRARSTSVPFPKHALGFHNGRSNSIFLLRTLTASLELFVGGPFNSVVVGIGWTDEIRRRTFGQPIDWSLDYC